MPYFLLSSVACYLAFFIHTILLRLVRNISIDGSWKNSFHDLLRNSKKCTGKNFSAGKVIKQTVVFEFDTCLLYIVVHA